MANIWLMKSEPDEVSFADALCAPHCTVEWFGVRNYQARNFMRDQMRIGDPVLFYHSSCPQPGIAGLARIASDAYPDRTQFDPSSAYYVAASSPQAPRWLAIDVQAEQAIELISLEQLRQHDALASMRVLARGNRLSITPVSDEEFSFIMKRLVRPAPATVES